MAEDKKQGILEMEDDEIRKLYEESFKENIPKGGLVKGKIVKITDREVIVNVGLKAEGVIPLNEFDDIDNYKVGDELDVFLDDFEDEDGLAVVSKKKADFIMVWDKIKQYFQDETPVEARVIRRVKGGLMVNMFGVEAFLPGSQVDVKTAVRFDDFIGQNVMVKVIKLNWKRRNIVVSRRILIEEERENIKKKFFGSVNENDIIEGVVKNITEFGAFVDLGGVDGLLHITDMSWGRLSHPSEILALGDTLKVKVIKMDKEKERVSLGLKQLTPNPWDDIEERYPIGQRVRGRVVSLTEYGAFIELEEGIEGLIHISEMSWTQHIKHPSEVMNIGDMVEAIVLEVDKSAQKVSLGLRQAAPDPWDGIEKKYPVGKKVSGKIINLTNFGAFVSLEKGVEGLLHISDISWVKRINHPKEVLKKGDKIDCKVLSIDREKRRISLGLKQLETDPFKIFIKQYKIGDNVTGKVTELLPRGVVVNLEKGLRGFVPFHHLAKKGIKKPKDKYKVNEILTLEIIDINEKGRNIILSERIYQEKLLEKEKEEEKKLIEEHKEQIEKESTPVMEELIDKTRILEEHEKTEKEETKEEMNEEKVEEEIKEENKDGEEKEMEEHTSVKEETKEAEEED